MADRRRRAGQGGSGGQATSTRIPPGVSAADFQAALGEFRAAVGADWVFTRDEDVALYKDAYSPFPGEAGEHVASAAVAPQSVEEVRQVVRVASRYGVPLYTVSTGRNLGYGGSSPTLSGSVILDLKRMNRIIEVDPVARTALVEPGVTFFDLYRYIQEKGYKLYMDLPSPAWGSPVGNFLDHGAGRAQLRDHFASHCGMEVVLADGDVVRTGMGAMPNSPLWQRHRYGFGPYIDGMFSQSNFAVVTKLGFYLMPQPEAMRELFVFAPRYQDVGAVVEILAYLLDIGVVDSRATLVSPLLTAPDPEIQQLVAAGAEDPEQWDRLARSKNLPGWRLELRLFGPEKLNLAHVAFIKEQFAAISGVTYQEKVHLLPPDLEETDMESRTWFGIPNLGIFTGLALQQSIGIFFFSPIIPMTGEAVLKSYAVFGKAFKELNLPWRIPPAMHYFSRTLTLLFQFDVSHDPAVNRQRRAAFERLVEVGAEHGWGEYRTPVAFQDKVMDALSFNDHALLRFHERVKDALDPKGVLSPGKSGIWPKRYRKARA